jgi:hypothetical protein
MRLRNMRWPRRSGGLLMCGAVLSAAALLLTAAPGTAFAAAKPGVPAAGSANAAAALKPCTFTTGKSSKLLHTHDGVVPDGTYFTMPANPQKTRCRDLNISYVSATDGYEGWLFNSHKDRWFPCHAGFVRITKGHHNPADPPVLCTVVLGTTKMAIAQESNTQHRITAEY